MAALPKTFASYQTQYECAFCPSIVYEACEQVKKGFHRVAIVIDEWNQRSDLVLKIAQFGTLILSSIPTVAPIVALPKQLCKDAKIFTGLFKGFRSVDNLLNLKRAWKFIVLQTSSMVLFAVSVLNFVERFNIFQVTTVKVMLSTIPVFGALPYGGALIVSLGSISSIMLLISVDKKEDLDRVESRIANEKLPFWSEPLDPSKVEHKQAKYAGKIATLTAEIAELESLLAEGIKIRTQLIQKNASKNQLIPCQKGIDALQEAIVTKKGDLDHYATKNQVWTLLKNQWTTIDPKELEKFRQAKVNKWACKLGKVRFEKKLNYFSMACSAFVIGKQLLSLSASLANKGPIPLAINLTIETIGMAADLTSFALKRILAEKKIPSVNAESYLNFSHTPEEVL